MEPFKRQQVDRSSIPQKLVEKWSRNTLDEGFVPFPKKLVRSLHRIFPDNESMKELSALLAVVDYKRPNLSRLPTLEYLAFLAGLDEAELTAALKGLESKGLVKLRGDTSAMEISLDGILDLIEKETADTTEFQWDR